MLFISSYIQQQLQKATYEYDPSTKSWCAWVKSLPGAYAQADSVEEARLQLAEVIEDYLIVSLQKGNAKQLFKNVKRNYASANAVA